jgi:hypothetical protein
MNVDILDIDRHTLREVNRLAKRRDIKFREHQEDESPRNRRPKNLYRNGSRLRPDIEGGF